MSRGDDSRPYPATEIVMSHHRRRHILLLNRLNQLTRRDFLRRSALAATAATTLPLLQACGSKDSPAVNGTLPDVRPSTPVSFKHGVASGDPLADRVILWTRLSDATSAQRGTLTVALDGAMRQVVATTDFSTDASRDYTVKVDQAGLQPATTYFYQFTVGTQLSPVGRTRTLPVGGIDHLRFGVAVCASLAHGYFNAYARLAERLDLDAVIHLGDYIYEYASDPASGDEVYGTVRSYEPTHEIRTLDDYRMRHAQYKRERELQAMHRQHVIIAIWDDHEFADNASTAGAVNHQPAKDGDWNARIAAALQAYYEWMPIRVQDASDLRRNYRQFRFGNLVDLFMLEERVGARSLQATPNGPAGAAGLDTFTETGDFADAGRQLLGTTEEKWLFDGLQASTATWKLLGQGVMVAQLKVVGLPNATTQSQYLNNDQWDGYNPARERLFDAIDGTRGKPVDNVVVLTGDIHTSWAANLSRDPNNPLAYNPLTGDGSLAVEFVCPSVTSPGLEQLNPLANALRLNNPHFQYIDLAQKGYMVIDITPTRTSGEWWYTGAPATRQATNSFGTAYQVVSGTRTLKPGTEAPARSNPPPAAP